MQKELYVFFTMIVCGGALMMFFDFERAFLRAIGSGKGLTAVCDILFWIIAGFCSMVCVWNFNSGIFRFYEPVGLVLGAVFYFCLLSKLFFGVFIKMIENILKFMRLIFKILLTPPRFLYKILVVPLIGILHQKVRKDKDSCDE